MSTKNVVMLVGRLAADAELKYLNNGTPVATFAIAVNRATRRNDGSFEDSLDGFFDCELFGSQALALSERCRKGTEIQLSGSLRQKKFQARGDNNRTVSRIEIRVETVAPALTVARSDEAGQPAAAEPTAV